MAERRMWIGPEATGAILGMACGLLFALSRSLGIVGYLLEIAFICSFGYISLHDPRGLLYLCASSVFVLTVLERELIFPFTREIMLVGLIFGCGLRRGWRFGKVVAVSVLPALAFAILLLISWPSISDFLGAQIEEANRSSLRLWERLGVGQGSSEQAQEVIQRTMDFILRVLPALGFLSALLAVVGAYALLRKLAPTLRVPPPPMRPFKEWRVWDYLIWAFIAGMALWIFGGERLQTLGWNILVVMGTLYILQGLAVARF